MGNTWSSSGYWFIESLHGLLEEASNAFCQSP